MTEQHPPGNTTPLDLNVARQRWRIYWLIIVIALGGVAGRILAVHRAGNDTPFLSANDKSRWSTIRALGDHGTYEIDKVILLAQNVKYSEHNFDRNWDSIDKVRHKGDDGREHYYSSKPPLLPTMLAGVYWCVKKITRGGLETHPFYIGRILLLATNLPALALMLWMFASIVEEYGVTVWGRFFAFATAACGTYATAFAVTLNNHLPAIVSVMLATGAALAIWRGRYELWRFALAGLAGAFAVANELPALAFFVLIGAAIFWKSPARAAIAFAPAAAIVAAAFFYTNYIAHDSLRPPYTHRSDGAMVATVTGDFDDELQSRQVPVEFRAALAAVGVDISKRATADLKPALDDGRVIARRWVLWDTVGQDRYAVVANGNVYDIHAWDNWYEYDGTHWGPVGRSGVDRGEDSRVTYLFHMLTGHHGLYSLTPVWLIATLGAFIALFGVAIRRDNPAAEAEAASPPALFAFLPLWLRVPAVAIVRTRHPLKLAAASAVLISVVVTAFYLMRPEIDRNYGGVSCCMRWLLWMTPMWLVCLIPAADYLSLKRWPRAVALLLLGVSIAGVQYSAGNPWTHPWLFQYWEYLDLIHYP